MYAAVSEATVVLSRTPVVAHALLEGLAWSWLRANPGAERTVARTSWAT